MVIKSSGGRKEYQQRTNGELEENSHRENPHKELTDLHFFMPQFLVVADEQAVIFIDGDVFDAKIEKIIEISIDYARITDVRLGHVGLEFTDRFVDVIAAQTGRIIVVVKEGLVITNAVSESRKIKAYEIETERELNFDLKIQIQIKI